MRLLLTRPEPDATAMARRLQAAGHDAMIEPLLAVVPAAAPAALDLTGVQASIVTSRNALRALETAGRLGELARLPLLAVGPGTADAARRIGFADVRAGPGTAADLVGAVTRTLTPAAGCLLHLSGADVAFDLVGALCAAGFDARRVVVYRTEARAALSEPVQQRLRAGDIDGALLMSPRTAEIYAGLIVRHDLRAHLGDVTHFCLSAAVASRLAPLGDVVKVISQQPNLEELLALVERVAAQFLHSLDDRS